MACVYIPDGVLTSEELKEFSGAVNKAVKEKERTGFMNLSRFMSIIKDACSYIWDKISGFISDIWGDIVDFFS